MSFLPALRPPASSRPTGGQPARMPACLSEVFAADPADAAAAGFVLARLGKVAGPILWVQDRLSRIEAGRPYLPGLAPGLTLLRVDVGRPSDVLAAMEDGLRCKALGAVIGEIWGSPAAVGFTASKRLALRSEAARLPCWLIRRACAPDLSAARERWRVATLPSAPHPDDPAAPGAPRWRAELFRSRFAPPGEWLAEQGPAEDRLDLSADPDGKPRAGSGDGGRHRAAG